MTESLKSQLEKPVDLVIGVIECLSWVSTQMQFFLFGEEYEMRMYWWRNQYSSLVENVAFSNLDNYSEILVVYFKIHILFFLNANIARNSIINF